MINGSAHVVLGVSPRYLGSTDGKAMAAALTAIDQSAIAQKGLCELDAFGWARAVTYVAVVRQWGGNRDEIIPFFHVLPETREVIFTTSAIGPLNMTRRK